MKKYYYILGLIVLCLVIFLAINYSTTSKIEQTEFLTEFSEKQGPCYPGNIFVSCETFAVFTYKDKEYNVTLGFNGYPKEACTNLSFNSGDCKKSMAVDSINLIDGKIKINGFYDHNKNLLFNYSIS